MLRRQRQRHNIQSQKHKHKDLTEAQLLELLRDGSKSLPITTDPVIAMCLYYVNSGYLRLQKHQVYYLSSRHGQIDNIKVVDEIRRQLLTEKEATSIIDTYYKCNKADNRYMACGVCGICLYERECDPCNQFTLVLLNNPIIQESLCCPKHTNRPLIDLYNSANEVLILDK